VGTVQEKAQDAQQKVQRVAEEAQSAAKAKPRTRVSPSNRAVGIREERERVLSLSREEDGCSVGGAVIGGGAAWSSPSAACSPSSSSCWYPGWPSPRCSREVVLKRSGARRHTVSHHHAWTGIGHGAARLDRARRCVLHRVFVHPPPPGDDRGPVAYKDN
jgi:hypothetical protein